MRVFAERSSSCEHEDIVVVTSFFLVGEAQEVL
jgi:hypothetical protein